MFIEFFFLIKVAANTFSLKRNKKWRTWVSIPVPPACKANPPARKTSVNN